MIALKMCPILGAAIIEEGSHPADAKCIEQGCAWWATVYTTEGLTVSGCAKELQCHMDSDGRYAV